MLKKLLLCSLLLVPSYTFADIRPLTEKEVILNAISVKAAAYGADEACMKEVIRHESGDPSVNYFTYNIHAYNPKDSDGLPAYGLSQFKLNTFYAYAKEMDLPNADISNPIDQIEVMAYMFATGEKWQWPTSKWCPKTSP